MSHTNGRQVQYFEYDRTFDQRYIIHVLGILLSVVKFGGQGLTKVARATPISRSSHAALRERARSSMSSHSYGSSVYSHCSVAGDAPEVTYMDVLVRVLLMYVYAVSLEAYGVFNCQRLAICSRSPNRGSP